MFYWEQLYYCSGGTGKGSDRSIAEAFAAANFSTSILAGTLVSLVIFVLFLLLQRIHLAEIQAHIVEGGQSVFGSLAILVLGWSLSTLTKDLGFLELIKAGFSRSFPTWAVPAVSFLTATATSYVIGSSWATWALIMPVALSLGTTGGLPPQLVIGAVWAGGPVGDTASPMGDIPILVSEILGINPTKYIESALPFTLFGVFLATVGYVVIGFLY